MAGQAWFTDTARVTVPVRPSLRNTRSTAPTPSLVQKGRLPSTPSSRPTARLRAQTWVSRLWLPASGAPSSSTAPGTGKVSSMLLGPRLLADVDVGSYPSPAADGRLWKYCGSGLPSGSTNNCPMILLPTGLPSALLTSDP
jgi:hypothetical protein